MHSPGRWDACVSHQGPEVSEFLDTYLVEGRNVLLLGGAGFDPRATKIAEELVATRSGLSAIFITEARPNPPRMLSEAAALNLAKLKQLIPNSRVIDVEVFGSDGAVLGGRRAVTAISQIPLHDITDVFVDVSALSIGTSFPVIRWLVESCISGASHNLHVVVAHSSEIDSSIRQTAGDRPGWVHGFGGGLGLDSEPSLAKLWMPQLAFESRHELSRIFDFVGPDDTCPILPFPAGDPRLADKLAIAFQQELQSVWSVDMRNIVYADEGDPLDLYRTILRIDDLRRPVFEGSGGSKIIVSPAGSKVTALGALMACLERDLPVAYLEAEAYEMIDSAATADAAPGLVHVWLEGDAYPAQRSPLRREAEAS